MQVRRRPAASPGPSARRSAPASTPLSAAATNTSRPCQRGSPRMSQSCEWWASAQDLPSTASDFAALGGGVSAVGLQVSGQKCSIPCTHPSPSPVMETGPPPSHGTLSSPDPSKGLSKSLSTDSGLPRVMCKGCHHSSWVPALWPLGGHSAGQTHPAAAVPSSLTSVTGTGPPCHCHLPSPSCHHFSPQLWGCSGQTQL